MLRIKIMGIPESKDTQTLYRLTADAIIRLQLDNYQLEVVGALKQMLAQNIGGIPALLINDRVAFEKEIPEVESIVEKLRAHLTGEFATV